MTQVGVPIHDSPSADPPDALPAIVDEFLMLVAETGAYHTEPEIKAVLQEAQRRLVDVRRRLHVASGRYVVAVVGLTNVGKSTLLNALLGDDVAPRRNRPCTAAPIEFLYSPELWVKVFFRNGLRRPRWACTDMADVHQRLEALADDAGAEASRSIQRITVELPHPLLKEGLTIADTPGFGAAQIADSAGSHEQALRDYLTKDVSQVFWVVLAEQGIGKTEMRFRDQFFAEVCDDVVVTGCEDWDQTDRSRFRKRYSQHFGQRLPQFHFVAGLEGLHARQSRDEEKLKIAGITSLEKRIRELDSFAGRTGAIRASLLTLAEDLRAWLSDYCGQGQGATSQWWRPDSWDRFAIALTRDDFGGQLVRRLEIQS
jgi:GTP-binding protein EngB required for normal cell division